MQYGPQEIELIRNSGLFDARWYLTEYPDVAATGIDPLLHYLRYGAQLRRRPGPRFDAKFYLAAHPDVAAAGADPLAHYLLNGAREGRACLPAPAAAAAERGERIDIVVPVFNALEDVKHCLRSLKDRQDGFRVRVIVVNDGSDSATTAWLRQICGQDSLFRLIEHDGNRGYTRAVNTGLRASDAPYVVTLNSDTIATRGWLKALVRCLASAPEIGLAGPLSNAASWQNVPQLFDGEGGFAINALPPGHDPDDMARVVASASVRRYPRLPFLNGFCIMMRRAVIDAVGFMDEENFPVGYGEENDFCIRAADAGFALAVADDAFVFHAKSKSFGHERRTELSRRGGETNRRKHGSARFDSLVAQVKQCAALDELRESVRNAVRGAAHSVPAGPAERELLAPKILFLLPVTGGGGGAHSVVQEASEMRRLGMTVKVAVSQDDLPGFLRTYQDVAVAPELFIGFRVQDVLAIARGFDVVVATVYSSVPLLRKIADVNPHILPAYYVQDYEPLFFAPGSDNWLAARDSYTLVPEAVLFAKTRWIADQVRREHRVSVRKVAPSIDHEVYRPAAGRRGAVPRIAAMIRPQTPVRGAERTMRVLSRLAQAHPGRVCFDLFGCAADDPRFTALRRDFAFRQHGVLKRPEVASLLAASDLFVDLSDYQAFGRTALEAMACGCTAVVPVHGGADEYAVDGVNALVVDSLDEDACFARLDALLRDEAALRRMQGAALLTASTFSIRHAAVSEITLFSQSLAEHGSRHAIVQKPRLAVMPARRKDGQPAGSGYVRVLLPYGSAGVQRHWDVNECAAAELPEPGSADVVLIQRDAGDIPLERLAPWLASWRAAGGRMVYEIDDDLLDAEGLLRRHYKGDAALLARKVRWLAGMADAVTVSTSVLREKFRSLNPNVFLVPNFLDEDLWRIGRPRGQAGAGHADDEATCVDQPVRIGYIGTPTHDQDLALVADAMRQLQKKYGSRIEIEVIGAFQNSPPLFGKRVALPRNSEYPNFVGWLHKRVNWDIAIIPLADDGFNESKSHLKFLECAALGLAIACSDVPSYRDVCKPGVNALSVPGSTDAWRDALERLIEDTALRSTLARNADDDLKRYTLEGNAGVMLSALDAALRGAPSADSGDDVAQAPLEDAIPAYGGNPASRSGAKERERATRQAA